MLTLTKKKQRLARGLVCVRMLAGIWHTFYRCLQSANRQTHLNISKWLSRFLFLYEDEGLNKIIPRSFGRWEIRCRRWLFLPLLVVNILWSYVRSFNGWWRKFCCAKKISNLRVFTFPLTIWLAISPVADIATILLWFHILHFKINHIHPFFKLTCDF